MARTNDDDGPVAVVGMRRLVIPEAVELEIPTASVGLRLLALLVDAVVIAIVFATMLWIAFSVATRWQVPGVLVNIAIVVVLALPLLVQWVMEGASHGRSVGKLVARLQVVTEEGGPIGWKHAGIRATIATLEIWATAGALATVTAMISSRGQRLGDMAAGTLVVRVANRSTDIRPVRFQPDAASQALAARLDVSAMDHADYQTVRAALLRRGLSSQAHARLCADVVRSLWPRVSSEALPTEIPAPSVLAAIASSFQAQHAAGTGQRAVDWVWQGMAR